MIQVVANDAIDREAWDLRLERTSDALWYARSWVLDAACPGWSALVDEGRGAFMPLTAGRKYGIAYLYQPFLLQQLGVFGSGGDEAVQMEFLRAIPKRYRFIDICLKTTDRVQALPGMVLRRNVDLLLDLSPDVEVLRAAYGGNHRRNLAKAMAAALEWHASVDPGTFLSFLQGTSAFAEWGLSGEQVRVLHALTHGVIARNEGWIVALRAEGAICAAGLFVEHGGRIIFLKGVANEEGRRRHAMFLLMDYVIDRYAGTACTLDLAGSNDAGTARFYAGFGAREGVYLRATINRLPLPIRWLKHK